MEEGSPVWLFSKWEREREITIADEGCFISNSIDVHTMAWGTLSFSESNVANAIIIFTWSLWNYVHVSCHITKWKIRNCKTWVLTQNDIILHMIINKRINQFLVFQIVQTIVMFSLYHRLYYFKSRRKNNFDILKMQ